MINSPTQPVGISVTENVQDNVNEKADDSAATASQQTAVADDVTCNQEGRASLGPESEKKAEDASNIITWDGPDDPQNPKPRLMELAKAVASFTFISPVSSAIVAPAIDVISKEFNITEPVEQQLVFSVFVLAYAVGPLFLGPLSEIYGRNIVLQLANLFYLVFNTAAGFSKNKGQMLAFRFLSGLGGSAPLAVSPVTNLVLSTFPTLWTTRYNESIGIAGLNYISLGLGPILGAQISALVNDRIYKRLKKRNGGIGRPEFRFPLMVPGSFLVPIGLIWYGWSAEKHLQWIMPNIGIIIYSCGGIIGFQCIQTYIVDAYTMYAASAIAAAALLRSILAFAFPLFAPDLYTKLGYGWGNSLLALCGLLLGVPAPFFLWKYGAMLRAKSPYAAGSKD
ncbi:MAG: hypothetical protein Q9187_000545 [Circinaria calcarea]